MRDSVVNSIPSYPLSDRYRFAEIRYHRPEEIHKGRLVPARVETVVIFLPDVWSCIPSRLEWEALQTSYKKQLSDKIAAELSDDTQASTCFPFLIIFSCCQFWCPSTYIMLECPLIQTWPCTHGSACTTPLDWVSMLTSRCRAPSILTPWNSMKSEKAGTGSNWDGLFYLSRLIVSP